MLSVSFLCCSCRPVTREIRNYGNTALLKARELNALTPWSSDIAQACRKLGLAFPSLSAVIFIVCLLQFLPRNDFTKWESLGAIARGPPDEKPYELRRVKEGRVLNNLSDVQIIPRAMWHPLEKTISQEDCANFTTGQESHYLCHNILLYENIFFLNWQLLYLELMGGGTHTGWMKLEGNC